ncbi:MAG: copper resistance protein CopC [Vicinamibacterales bacterium]
MTLKHVVAMSLAVGLASTVVLAHMKASKFEPAADSTVTTTSRVQVWFTQAPDPAVSKIELAGPNGAVTLGAVQVTAEKSIMAVVEGSLGNGRYTASWQAAGDDGHVQKGTYSFTVQNTR